MNLIVKQVLDLKTKLKKSERKKNVVTEIFNVTKKFHNGIEALKNLNLNIYQGDFLTLLGQSGCGKSTILKLLCGLLKPTEGRVTWPTSTFTNSKDNPANLSVVFQEPNLMPWLNVLENIKIPLKLINKNRHQSNKRVNECLKLVGLEKFSYLYPNQLSGGMKMRVALARALVTDPKVLLLDEPFAALDELNRFKLNDELLYIYRQRKLTIIFITHSIYESVYLSNKIALISNQPGTVLEEIPLNNFVEKRKNYRLSNDYLEKCKMISEKIYLYDQKQKTNEI